MKSEIITIGDEILIGQILDTNSQYISQALNRAGITVGERTSIGDDAVQIIEALDHALHDYDIVTITGGLGPTKDDITKHTLTRYFGSQLRYDEQVADHVRTLLARRGITSSSIQCFISNGTPRSDTTTLPSRSNHIPGAVPWALNSTVQHSGTIACPRLR